MDKHIMYNFSREDHRQRLENLRFVEKHTRRYGKKNLITDYIQGQYVWPKVRLDHPDEDEALLKFLSEKGVGLIQTWEHMADFTQYTKESGQMDPHQGEWMYRPYDKELGSKFIDMVHQYGMKIVPYTSTNFYVRKAADFEEGWAFPKKHDLAHLAHCSANSPGWRERIIRQYATLLDEYDFDGVYIDAGYLRTADYLEYTPYYMEEPSLVADEVRFFTESHEHDGGMEDLLGLIYGEVKRRGGILKLHKEGVDRIHSDIKVYDYLWVGEAVESIDFIRKRTKDYDAYVIPDYNFKVAKEHERYLNTIPYMQFPVLRDDRMGIGSPDAGVPDFELALKWLKLYQEMTRYGTWCYIDIEAPQIVRTFSEDMVVTAFVNREVYIVVANYSASEEKVLLGEGFTEITVDGVAGRVARELSIPARNMKVLRMDNCAAEHVGDNAAAFETSVLLGE